MSNKWEKLAASMAVGVVVSGLLATPLNAITVATPYEPTANTPPPASVNLPGGVSVPAGPTVREQRVAFEKWLDRLAWAESNNRARIRVVDVNGLYSYGCLQFQMATFRAYARTYQLVVPSDDLYKLIYDCGFQRTLATRMIKEDPANVSHWGYSVYRRGVGRPPATGL